MHNAVPLPIEKMSTAQFLCQNSLFGGRKEFIFSLFGEEWTLKWEFQASNFSKACVLGGLCASEPFKIWFDDYQFLCHDDVITKEVLENMPEELVKVALNVFLEPLALEASSFIQKKISVSSIAFEQDFMAHEHVGLAFTLASNKQKIHAFLETAFESYLIDFLCDFWQAEKAILSSVDDLPIISTPILESFHLPLDELSKIKLNDCILGMNSAQEGGLPIRSYITKHGYFTGIFIENTLTIQGNYMQDHTHNNDHIHEQDYEQEHEQGHEQEDLSPSSEVLDTNSLPIKVDFALDPIELTVGKIASMQNGEVFVTTSDMDSPISVLVNGKCIAKGKLVDISGRIGVQILEIKV